MTPGSPEYEAKVAADIARLQAAKGIQIRAWIRENKAFLPFIGVYFAIIAAYGGIAYAKGDPPGAGLIFGVFMGPIVMLRMWLRWRRAR